MEIRIFSAIIADHNGKDHKAIREIEDAVKKLLNAHKMATVQWLQSGSGSGDSRSQQQQHILTAIVTW